MFGAGVGTNVNADGQPATALLAAGELLVERIASLAFEPDGESEALDDEHSYKLDGQKGNKDRIIRSVKLLANRATGVIAVQNAYGGTPVFETKAMPGIAD
ncbi:uncharacterized protein FRV6_12795 [Fusarium oxysporum]|uniref:Uncharacterized protein n=1 Tax=Fusarium oxysporum TaxID=5507 RepID=A0A2H3TIZ5_FUSOX|nr:uncharacterized protein FRV6_12795 [Fusarium oxysporum]